MPKWIIDGADKTTGADRSITIDASTEAEAMAQAAAAGMLVSSVKPARPAESGGLALALLPRITPDYKRISEGSKTLNIIGWIIGILGWGFLAFAALMLVVMLTGIGGGLGMLASGVTVIMFAGYGAILIIIVSDT